MVSARWSSERCQLINQINTALNVTFGGTILQNAVNTFMYCILGSKIDNLQTALTWIHQNANVRLPLLSLDALTLSNATTTELATPLAAAAVGTGTDEDGGVIGRIFDAYAKELRDQRLIALAFCGLYLFIVLVAAMILLRHTIWPITFIANEMQEDPLIHPTKRGRHNDEASYFELEDVPLQPADTDIFNEKTAVPPTTPRSKGSLQTLWRDLRIPAQFTRKSPSQDPFVSPLDSKIQ
jgi:hypothetical protein